MDEHTKKKTQKQKKKLGGKHNKKKTQKKKLMCLKRKGECLGLSAIGWKTVIECSSCLKQRKKSAKQKKNSTKQCSWCRSVDHDEDTCDLFRRYMASKRRCHDCGAVLSHKNCLSHRGGR